MLPYIIIAVVCFMLLSTSVLGASYIIAVHYDEQQAHDAVHKEMQSISKVTRL